MIPYSDTGGHARSIVDFFDPERTAAINPEVLCAADNLAHSKWDKGILRGIEPDHRLTHFHISLEIAKYITEDTHE